MKKASEGPKTTDKQLEKKIELKEIKPEKVENKEFSKVEIGEKHIPKEKDGKELVENPGDIYDPVRDIGLAKEYLAQLEEAAQRMRHFIESAERPDMDKDALKNEPGKGA